METIEIYRYVCALMIGITTGAILIERHWVVRVSAALTGITVLNAIFAATGH